MGTHAFIAVGRVVICDMFPRHGRGLTQHIPVLLSFPVDTYEFGLDAADARPRVRATLGTEFRESSSM